MLMTYTEAQKRATLKYLSTKTDDIRLRVPRGTKERYKTAAKKEGVSMTKFITEAVEEKIKARGLE